MGVRVFMLEPTSVERRALRRYAGGSTCTASGMGYHNAETDLGIVAGGGASVLIRDPEEALALDDRWPTHCACGYKFHGGDEWQDCRRSLYRRADTKELVTLHDAPPGACWDAEWFHGHQWLRGPDGRSLTVICPDGRQWTIDGRASNCTMKDDNVHKCWVRHGSPEAGDLTVDKNGVTCAAGAGSIDTGTYHGFLRNGDFVPA